jgi:hypothetical protein
MEVKKISQTNEINEKNEQIEKESKKVLKLVLNGIIKLNNKELKEKWYIDLSAKWVRKKLNILLSSLEKSKTLSSSTKKALEAFKENFLKPENTHIIKFLQERLILNKHKEISETNIDEYFSIIKNTLLSLNDLWKKSDKKDIDFYVHFIEKISWNNNLLNKFPDLKIILTELLPSISKYLDKSKLSSALDTLFSSSKQDILKFYLEKIWKNTSYII